MLVVDRDSENLINPFIYYKDDEAFDYRRVILTPDVYRALLNLLTLTSRALRYKDITKLYTSILLHRAA